MPQTDADWDFEIGNVDGDGYVELIAVNRRNAGSSRTAVHALSSKDNCQSIVSHVSGLGFTNGSWDFE